MGGGRLGRLGMAARFDHDNGPGARGCARRGHEFSRVFYGLDVEEDRARSSVHCEEIEQIAEIDVDLIADRHQC